MDKKFQRTALCGRIGKSDIGRVIILNGWVHSVRNHGAMSFISLRDRYGIAQVVVDESSPKAAHEAASSLHNEMVIAVKGKLRARPGKDVNSEMQTGAVELVASEITVLNTCEVLPFQVEEETQAKEDLRLKYRYIDLRSEGMQRRIALRHNVVKAIRDYLSYRDFYEIETPTMIRSTPEGARDFLVPSRTNPGKFYALPQSPQLMKQLLMVSGFDKYFQIARCYRDEDARGDRQPEFTQLDLEMSFVTREDVLSLMEGMFGYVFDKVVNYKLPATFRRLTFKDAMDKYGCDKPDLRFGLEIQDCAEILKKSSFEAAKVVLEGGGFARAICVPKQEGVEFSRKFTDDLAERAKVYGAGGLAFFKVSGGTDASGADKGPVIFTGGAAKYFIGIEKEAAAALGAHDGDLVVFLFGPEWRKLCTQMGAIRSRLGEVLNLADPKRFQFCWIVDFPLFAWNEETGHWEAEHHMFSRPQERFIPTLEQNPGEVLGDLYDLVLNGYEVASGSIRIHDVDLQKRIFRICNYSDEQAERAFGFLLEAFKYGAPPHGGIAPGIDRLCMIISGKDSIREVIAFPKNTFGASPMDESPAPVEAAQLDELHIALKGVTDN